MRLSFLLPLVVLSPFAVGQEPETAPTTAAAPSALTITTNDPELAAEVLEMFDSKAELPEFGDGKGAVLSLDDGGKLVVHPTETTGWLHVDAHPAALMDLFAAQIAQQQMMLQMMGGMALGQMGVGQDEVTDVLTAVLSFPKQIDTIVVSAPQPHRQGEPMAVDVDLTPKASTWFGALVGNLQQAPGQVPMLPSTEATAARVDASIDAAKILPQLEPLIGTFAGIGQEGKEARAKAARLLRDYVAALSGASSAVFDNEGGMRSVFALTDPAKMIGLLESPDYAATMQAYADASGMGMVDTKIEPAALTHRDVTVTRTVVDVAANDFAPASKTESYSAVAADVLLTTSSDAGATQLKALVDRVLDEDLERTAMPAGELLRAHVAVAKLMAGLRAGADAEDEDAPETVDVSLAKTASGLKLKVNFK